MEKVEGIITVEDLNLSPGFVFQEPRDSEGPVCPICCDCCLCETGGV